MEMENLMKGASDALKKAAVNEEAKSYLLSNRPLFVLLKKAANRFIAGEELAETIERVQSINARNVACTVDFMGESIRLEEEANQVVEEFLSLARAIKTQHLNSTISLDLSHIGLEVSRELTLQNLQRICEEGIEVMISAEGFERTDQVISTYVEAAKSYPNIGITLQAYFHRTVEDLEELMEYPGKIRIVKGAFSAPAGTYLERGKELNQRYMDMVERLLLADHKCSIATHDEHIQVEVGNFLQKTGKTENYEYESLLGIENERIFTLNEQYPTRIYVVYGKEWYLYLCNRIAENPANLFQAVVDMVG